VSADYNNGQSYCIGLNAKQPITVKAHKIICETEDLLPDWADGGPGVITSTTHEGLVAVDGCDYAPSWQFEYQWGGDNPGDNTGDNAGLPNFDTPSNGATPAEVELEIRDDTLWVREHADSDYIPFFGQDSNTPKSSAEMYCSAD